MIVMASHPETTDETAELAASVDFGPLPGLLGYALRRAQIAVFNDFHRCFAELDIRPTQFSVLQMLKFNPGLRQTQVSAALGIKRTNFVPLFDGLQGRGLAERRPVAGDRRAFALYLTDAGIALVDELDRVVQAHEARFARRLGEQGRHQLISLLHRLMDPGFDVG